MRNRQLEATARCAPAVFCVWMLCWLPGQSDVLGVAQEHSFGVQHKIRRSRQPSAATESADGQPRPRCHHRSKGSSDGWSRQTTAPHGFRRADQLAAVQRRRLAAGQRRRLAAGRMHRPAQRPAQLGKPTRHRRPRRRQHSKPRRWEQAKYCPRVPMHFGLAREEETHEGTEDGPAKSVAVNLEQRGTHSPLLLLRRLRGYPGCAWRLRHPLAQPLPAASKPPRSNCPTRTELCQWEAGSEPIHAEDAHFKVATDRIVVVFAVFGAEIVTVAPVATPPAASSAAQRCTIRRVPVHGQIQRARVES